MPNTIERQISIDASALRVWELVSEPGWWVNDGEIVPHEISRDGDVATVTDPDHGTCRISVLELDPPRYARFGWLAGASADVNDQETTIEFWVTETGSGVELKVRETGFDDLPVSDEQRTGMYDDNVSGWELELAAAQRHCRQEVSAPA